MLFTGDNPFLPKDWLTSAYLNDFQKSVLWDLQAIKENLRIGQKFEEEDAENKRLKREQDARIFEFWREQRAKRATVASPEQIAQDFQTAVEARQALNQPELTEDELQAVMRVNASRLGPRGNPDPDLERLEMWQAWADSIGMPHPSVPLSEAAAPLGSIQHPLDSVSGEIKLRRRKTCALCGQDMPK